MEKLHKCHVAKIKKQQCEGMIKKINQVKICDISKKNFEKLELIFTIYLVHNIIRIL